jgi:uncharacterized caspase-like protein
VNATTCCLLALFVAFGFFTGAAHAQDAAARRVALVVGNNAYPTAPLLNPINDARAMAQALQRAGFTVILRTDATQPELTAAVREFGNQLKDGGPGTAGLFYFAGHGMQIRGRNFLIPAGANIEHEDEVSYQALDAQAVLDKMESAGNGSNLMILDACRNNPFARSFRSGRQGLAQMDAPVGSVVAFSTAPGSVASDGSGTHGLYTAHLLNAMKRPGAKVEDVFKQVRQAVLRDSSGRQVPWEATSLVGDFYFTPPQAGAAPLASAPALPPADPQALIDDALWSALKGSPSSAELYAYLNRFPSGRHAREARQRLSDLVAPGAGIASGGLPLPLPPGATPDAPKDEGTDLAGRREIDEILRWGDLGTARRPPGTQANSRGFALGDRYRWQTTDLRTDRYLGEHLWRIDGLTVDGQIQLNDEQARVDTMGQIERFMQPRTGQWMEWSVPLPVAEVATKGVGYKRDVRTRLTVGGGSTRSYWLDCSGTAKAVDYEAVTTKAGRFEAVRVEVELRGRGSLQRATSFPQASVVELRLVYWYVRGIGMPVASLWEERRDGFIEQQVRQELTALDVQSAPPAVAASRP